MFQVFHRQRAGRPLRTIWALEEAGAPYELVVMTPEEGKGEAHLGRHPLGRVPVVDDGNGFLFESAAICLHIGDVYPDSGLLPPSGTHDRALVYQWACFAPAELEPPLFEVMTQADRDPDRAAAARKRFFRAADAVVTALDGSDHLVAGRLTVADVMVGTTLLFTTRAGLMDELPPSLTEYWGKLAQRPAFQRAFQRNFAPAENA